MGEYGISPRSYSIRRFSVAWQLVAELFAIITESFSLKSILVLIVDFRRWTPRIYLLN